MCWVWIRLGTPEQDDMHARPGPLRAQAWGRLLAASGTSDIADAHVVICARRADQPIVTSDPGDLQQLDPALRLIAL
jgi:hypothetical protein